MFCRGLLQRIKLDVAEENLRPLGLKKDLSASGKRTRSLIDESAIDILFYAACLVYQLENIPLAVRLLHFSGGIAIARLVLPASLTNSVDLGPLARRTLNPGSIPACEGSAIGHPEVSRGPFADLKFD